MSLQVNLASKEIAEAYEAVINARQIDWAIFTYDGGSNDLKVQATGSGGLEELQDEFSDGRIQYAFARVKDLNSQLPKFVQINWCGDGVPESKKGLFHSHSSAVARFLRSTHVVVSARNEGDVIPEIIMKRVEAASGAKYTAKKRVETAPPLPPPAASRPPTIAKSPRPAFSAIAPSTSQPAASPVRAVTSVMATPVSSASTKPSEDRNEPIKSSYTPVSLATPKKLKNPFAAFEQRQLSASQTSYKAPSTTTAKKLTWSERQAKAKKQAEEDNNNRTSPSASFSPPAVPAFESNAPAFGKPAMLTSIPRNFGVVKAAVGVGAIGGGMTAASSLTDSVRNARNAVIDSVWGTEDKEPLQSKAHGPESQDAAASSPPAPAELSNVTPSLLSEEVDDLPATVAPPPPPPPPPPPSSINRDAPDVQGAASPVEQEHEHEPEPETVPERANHEYKQKMETVPPIEARASQGVVAVVLYDYEAGEDNEISLVEGDYITEIEENDEGWWSGVGPDGKRGLFPSNYIELVHLPPSLSRPLSAAVQEHDTPVSHSPAGQESVQDGDITAVALYEYDAAEDNEISFREGHTIKGIEPVSEHWWSGINLNGDKGLFPANYVQIQE